LTDNGATNELGRSFVAQVESEFVAQVGSEQVEIYIISIK